MSTKDVLRFIDGDLDDRSKKAIEIACGNSNGWSTKEYRFEYPNRSDPGPPRASDMRYSAEQAGEEAGAGLGFAEMFGEDAG